jgi:hypothetical protein
MLSQSDLRLWAVGRGARLLVTERSSGGLVGGRGRMVSQSHAELFGCPNCNSQYKLVRVEAEPEPSHGRIECYHCGGPLHGREGRFILEILSDRPAASATQANARQVGRCAAGAASLLGHRLRKSGAPLLLAGGRRPLGGNRGELGSDPTRRKTPAERRQFLRVESLVFTRSRPAAHWHCRCLPPL